MKDLVGQNLGNYHILEEVGRGGMATVFKAIELASGQVVAMKVLSPYVAQEPKFKARFEQEIRVLLELHHPNIVPVLDYGEIDEYSFIVMPFLTSGTLSQRLAQGPLPLKAAADVVRQISQALDYAHARGIVHRDLKPSNILITDDGQAMLTDFGFARVADTSLSLTGSALIGTPAYMSPEQCRGEEATPLSDQYALGVVLYHMATGTLPYEAETPMGLVIMHATEPIPPPRDVNPDLPEYVEMVILKALEKEPENRYPSLNAFNEAVQFAVSGRRSDLSGYADEVLFGHPTEAMDGFKTKLTKSYMRVQHWMQTQPSALFLIVVALASILWGIFGFQGDGSEAGEGTEIPIIVAGTDRSAELEMTIEALLTSNAPAEGTALGPGAVETAVAGTLEVYLATSQSNDKDETLIRVPTEDAKESHTPSATATFFFYFSTTPTRSGPRPTSLPGVTPNPTAPITPTPVPTGSTDTPTSIPPTKTSSPPPTIDPARCKYPGHPVWGCTPTPTP